MRRSKRLRRNSIAKDVVSGDTPFLHHLDVDHVLSVDVSSEEPAASAPSAAPADAVSTAAAAVPTMGAATCVDGAGTMTRAPDAAPATDTALHADGGPSCAASSATNAANGAEAADDAEPVEARVVAVTAEKDATSGGVPFVLLNDGVLPADKLLMEDVRELRESSVRVALAATTDATAVIAHDYVDERVPIDELSLHGTKERVIRYLVEKGYEVERVQKSQQVEELLRAELEQGRDTSFYLFDIDVVCRKYRAWKQLLPRVHPFYAVKCCPDPVMVHTLHLLGAGFDVASAAEIDQVLGAGAQVNDVIFANPSKSKAHIRHAKSRAVRVMTFDNEAELHKVKEVFPDCELVLRILPPDTSFSMINLGSKFGADWEESRRLLKVCKQLGLAVRGVSFHVGSGCFSSEAFVQAIEQARRVFDEAEALGFKMDLLDIGGGYPGTDDNTSISLKDIADAINPVLDRLFSADRVRVIAEPGRYFATEAMALAVNIVSKRQKRVCREGGEPHPTFMYYLSDGVYGSFNNIFYDHYRPDPRVLTRSASQMSASGASNAELAAAATSANAALASDTPANGPGPAVGRDDGAPLSDEPHHSTLFGPTCDSIDVVCQDVSLPELEVGDWLYFLNMGAYTRAAGSSFNGFTVPPVKYICS